MFKGGNRPEEPEEVWRAPPGQDVGLKRTIRGTKCFVFGLFLCSRSDWWPCPIVGRRLAAFSTLGGVRSGGGGPSAILNVYRGRERWSARVREGVRAGQAAREAAQSVQQPKEQLQRREKRRSRQKESKQKQCKEKNPLREEREQLQRDLLPVLRQ